MLRWAGLMRKMEVPVSQRDRGIGGGLGLGVPKRRDCKVPVWFVTTPVDPETKVPTEQVVGQN
jgi:hypothetical protein